MNKFIVLVFMGILLSGCGDSNAIMNERFGDKKPHILYDIETQDKYVVIHHIKDTYMVMPLD